MFIQPSKIFFGIHLRDSWNRHCQGKLLTSQFIWDFFMYVFDYQFSKRKYLFFFYVQGKGEMETHWLLRYHPLCDESSLDKFHATP
jgi:hypothetical protein